MIYIGIPVEYEEACRIVGCAPDDDIVSYLANQLKTPFELHGIDKNLCVLGLAYTKLHDNLSGGKTAIETLADLMNLCHEWKMEVKRLKLDLSCVEMARMEEMPYRVAYPEPMIFQG